VEQQLAKGELAPDAIPLLLEAVRHLLRCRFRPGAASQSTERRRQRKNSPGSKQGHGRGGAGDYSGGEHVAVAHPQLKAGDGCPEAGCRGKLYDTRSPSRDVELKAAAPVQATVYECQVLRCASCQKTFTAPLPSTATGTKYHPSVDAVLAVMRYGLGLPHNRLAQWQRWAGVPLPASTQYERVEALADAVLPVFRQLETLAANRPLLHSDDTGARILALMAENKTKAADERTGIFTTGIVARSLERLIPPIVLYASGRRHAGENLDRLLSRRSVEAGAPIHMADASSMAPRLPRIQAHCLVHARRYFVEAYAAFPEHCERVLDDIASVYQLDAATRGMDPQARLVHHQTHSAPLLKTLYAWIEQQFEERLVEPNSRLGKAFGYLKNHWQGLTRFLSVPGVPLDNNETERELKPAQRHRKNSLFFKNETGAAVGDVLLSLIRTSVASGVDPVHYLAALAKHETRARAAPQAWLPWSYTHTLSALN
jgi:transposase